MSEFNYLKLETSGSIAQLTFDRPPVNALNMDVLHELHQTLLDIARQETVRVLILTGAGKAFIAGADIAQMQHFDALQARAFAHTGQRVYRLLEEMPQVVIAAINGFALGGGCEISLACDLRIASEKAKFGQPEVNIGVIPGFGGTQRLPRLIGMAKAKELIFTGDMIDATTAAQIGLVNAVVAPEALLETAQEWAKKLISRGPTALKLAKAVMNRGMDCSLDAAFAYEADAFALCFPGGEAKEGMSTFLETKQNKDWSHT